nr:hypothetical protein [Xylanibacter rodentium]
MKIFAIVQSLGKSYTILKKRSPSDQLVPTTAKQMAGQHCYKGFFGRVQRFLDSQTDLAIGFIDKIIAEYDIGILFLRFSIKPLKHHWLNIVIGISMYNIFATSSIQSRLPGSTDPAIVLMYHLDSFIMSGIFITYHTATVGRTIIDYDNLKIIQRLLLQTL